MKHIFFNNDLIPIVKSGQKTCTRRPVPFMLWAKYIAEVHEDEHCFEVFCQAGETKKWTNIVEANYWTGDVLYVPEAWKACVSGMDSDGLGYKIEYRSGGTCKFRFENHERAARWQKYIYKPDVWQSPYFMPKEAARTFIRVTDVSLERLCDITEDDALAEGISSWFVGMGETGYSQFRDWDTAKNNLFENPIGAFRKLWDAQIKPKDRSFFSWKANPWVLVYHFERCEKE